MDVTYRMTALLLETTLVWFRVALEIRLESYVLRHALQLFSNTTLCTKLDYS